MVWEPWCWRWLVKGIQGLVEQLAWLSRQSDACPPEILALMRRLQATLAEAIAKEESKPHV